MWNKIVSSNWPFRLKVYHAGLKVSSERFELWMLWIMCTMMLWDHQSSTYVGSTVCLSMWHHFKNVYVTWRGQLSFKSIKVLNGGVYCQNCPHSLITCLAALCMCTLCTQQQTLWVFTNMFIKQWNVAPIKWMIFIRVLYSDNSYSTISKRILCIIYNIIYYIYIYI